MRPVTFFLHECLNLSEVVISSPFYERIETTPPLVRLLFPQKQAREFIGKSGIVFQHQEDLKRFAQNSLRHIERRTISPQGTYRE